MQAGFDRDLELGPDTVSGCNQDRILEAHSLEVEHPPEPADFGLGADARGSPDHRFDQIDQTIASVNINARIRVSEALFTVDHA